ncbi:peptidoglycan recognition protein-like [Contarinia nasturtii]|uniref:peptidoglycan recognition protein-like n=1 Tax=Contarinia nasturtii TaxID=265458 RepID=UPI0012D4477F|nr:peptidoglycan recognition protein-like [Contarinia nasturtii]
MSNEKSRQINGPTGLTDYHVTLANNHKVIESRSIWMFMIVVLICTLTGVLFGAYLTKMILQQNPTVQYGKSTEDLNIIERNKWNAKSSQFNLSEFKLPVKRIIIASTNTENCNTTTKCIERVQKIQEKHQTDGLNDIAYNFLVGDDGGIYIGRGWEYQGEHTKGYDSDSICIAFIGTFDVLQPSHQQLHSAHGLIEVGVEKNHIISDYDLYGQSQLLSRNDNSPGTLLFDIIKTWYHWKRVAY